MPPEWKEQWGRNIRFARELRGLTQAQLAEKIGISAASLCRWEKGVVTPRDHHKVAIAEALNADVRALFPLMRGAA